MFRGATIVSLSQNQYDKVLQDFHILTSTDTGFAIFNSGVHPVAGDGILVSSPEGGGALIVEQRHLAVIEHFIQ